MLSWYLDNSTISIAVGKYEELWEHFPPIGIPDNHKDPIEVHCAQEKSLVENGQNCLKNSKLDTAKVTLYAKWLKILTMRSEVTYYKDVYSAHTRCIETAEWIRDVTQWESMDYLSVIYSLLHTLGII